MSRRAAAAYLTFRFGPRVTQAMATGVVVVVVDMFPLITAVQLVSLHPFHVGITLR